MIEYDRFFEDVEKQHAGNEFITVHCRRYAMSMDWIRADLEIAKSALEVGGACPFTTGLRHFFPHLAVEHTHPSDLRTVFTEKRNHYDLVLNMEVIEHINDLEADDKLHLESYAGDGVLNFVNTCFTCLKPGGKMFLTTPNLSSMGSIWRAMLGWHPHSYHLHVHEMAKNELWQKLVAAGFKIVRYETFDCYAGDRVPPHVADRIMAALQECNCPVQDRAAVQFVMALKPA